MTDTMRKGQKTREKILAAACQLFQVKGFRATSFNDLLEATGLKKGGLYFHFASKDELAMAALEREQAEHLSFVDGSLQGDSPAAKLANHLDAIIDWQRSTGCVGGCIFGNTALEMGDTDPAMARFVDQVFSNYVAQLSDVVRQAQQAGELRSDLAAEVIARHILSTIEGGIMQAKLKKQIDPLQQSLDALRTLLWRPQTDPSSPNQEPLEP